RSDSESGPRSERLGLCINWGRSAIEGRSAHTAIEHVQAAAEAGVLGAVIFSGASGVGTPWGPAWSDSHIPMRGEAPALAASSGSLLGRQEIASTLQAAGNLSLMGVKVSVRPTDADVPTRLAVARAALDQVGLARAQIRLPRTEESTAASPEADPSHTPAGRNP
ncbi:MAG TPA: DUF4862 family protein, partial [Dermatophilaceae bacterium]